MSSSSPKVVSHIIATYNMSFAGDLGLDPSREDVFESEGSFHLSNTNKQDLRSYWKNSLNLVIHFWKYNKSASVMGLQEMNKTVNGLTGSNAVKSSLSKFKYIDMITSESSTKAGLSLIWNRQKLGKMVASQIESLDYFPVKDDPLSINDPKRRQLGRPILMGYTENGFLLIVLHAPNDDKIARLRKMVDFKDALNTKVQAFVNYIKTKKDCTIYGDRIFIMGDFNDKYDALQLINLEVDGKQYNLSYKGQAPLSCCHNWDSSCTASRFQKLNIDRKNNIGTCNMPEDGRKYTLAGRGKRFVMGHEGDINNYRYYGDKVFGGKPVGKIKIYRPKSFVHKRITNQSNHYSQESDHEMVIGIFKTN
jgi:hypothetical protein